MTESEYWSSEKYYLGSTRTEYSLEPSTHSSTQVLAVVLVLS